MANADDFLQSVLGRHGLAAPDRRMLFRYRLSMEDYLSLREIVGRDLTPNGWGRSQFGTRNARALFVLYAAEWWKRDYNGGPWRWSPLLESLGVGAIDLHPNERTLAVESGLNYWGHRPSEDGKRFFGAIVAHGGLPMRVIAKGVGGVSTLLEDGLRNAHRYGWMEFELEQYFSERAGHLNQHLREFEIYRLFSTIVTTVLAMRSDYNLGGAEKPIEILDEREPAWRDRFPMSLDDDAATRLVAGLVREAAKVQRHAIAAAAVVVDRFLGQRSDGSFELVSTVQFPRALPVESLVASCGIPVPQVPRYFSLDIQTTKRQLMCQGRLLLSDDSSTATLEGKFPVRSGTDALAEHLLILRDAQGDLGEPAGLPGGQVLDEDMPWTFEPRGERWALVSVGSCRSPAEEARVVVRHDAYVEPADQDSQVDKLGTVDALSYGAIVYLVRGSAKVEIEGTIYRIRTRQPVAIPDQLVWKGRRLPHVSHPLPIFLGAPTLYRYLENGESRIVPATELEWMSASGEGRPVGNPKLHRGPVEVWWRPGGERLSRFRFVIEGTDAKVSFASGVDELHGSIGLMGFATSNAAALGDLRVNRQNVPGGCELNLEAVVVPPLSVPVSLLWPNSPRVTTLVLPFPSSGGHFFDALGRQLANGVKVSVRALAGARLRVFDRDPAHPKSYSLLLELRSPEKRHSAVGLHRTLKLSVDRSGIVEVRLIDLESAIVGLLGQSDELDAQVMVTLSAGTRALTHIFVTRYQASITSIGNAFELSSDELVSATFETLSQTELLAIPLLLADGVPKEIEQRQSEGCPVGVWDVSTLDSESAPWLLYPKRESAIQFRPGLHLPKGDAGDSSQHKPSLCPLGAAMSESDSAARRQLLEVVLQAMADDLDHPSWRLVAHHWRHLSHLPLSVLDSWRAMARNLSACLTCLLKLPEEATAIARRMRDDLGVVWELVSFKELANIAIELEFQWSKLLGGVASPKLAIEAADAQMRSVAEAIPVLALPVALARMDGRLSAPIEALELQREIQARKSEILDGLWRAGSNSMGQQLLLRVHADDENHWPMFGLTMKAIEELQGIVKQDDMREIAKNVHALFRLPQAGNAGVRQVVEHWIDVANVPSICAVWAILGLDEKFWLDPSNANAIRQIKAFDPLWFEEAYRQAIRVCVAAGLWQPTRKVQDDVAKRRVVRAAPPSGPSTH